jgi:hypothetical protein
METMASAGEPMGATTVGPVVSPAKTCAERAAVKLTTASARAWLRATLIDRINTVNARLYNAQGQRRLLISRRCTQLIRALDRLTYKEGSKISDKGSGLDHIADALGYLIMGVSPIITDSVSIQTVRI